MTFNTFFCLFQYLIIFVGLPSTIASFYIKSELKKRAKSVNWLIVERSDYIEYYRIIKKETNTSLKRRMKFIFWLSLGMPIIMALGLILFIIIVVNN